MAPERLSNEVLTIWNKNFICVVIANFMHCLSHAAFNPLVASYMKHMGASVELTGLLTGLFFGVSFMMRPAAGPLTTKTDKRVMLIIVFAAGCVADLGYAFFRSIPAFVAFRFLSGFQYSLVGSLLITLTGDHLPKEKLTYGLGLYGIGGAIGNAVGPTLGILLLNFGTETGGDNLGFTLPFLFSAIILAVAVIPCAAITPDKKSKEELAGTGAWYKTIFTIHALPSAIATLLLMMPYSILNTYMVEFGKELGISGISVFFTVLALMLAVSRPLSGYLTGKLGTEKIVVPALAIFAVSMLVVGWSKSLWMLVIGAALVAFGFGASQPGLQAMSMQSETAIKRGVAANTMYMGIDLGLFVGPYLGGFVYKFSGSYSTVFKIGALPLALGIVFFITILPIHRRRQKALETL